MTALDCNPATAVIRGGGHLWRPGLLAVALSASLAVSAPLAKPAWAQHLPKPMGRVILSISGHISHTNGEGVAQFDRHMLAALPTMTIETMTPWTEGMVLFEGPLVRDVMTQVGAKGRSVMARALNDYTVEIPMSDFETYPVILAMTMNGETLRTRSKGPLWVIYPWSEQPDLRTEVGYGRAIWQVTDIIVRE